MTSRTRRSRAISTGRIDRTTEEERAYLSYSSTPSRLDVAEADIPDRRFESRTWPLSISQAPAAVIVWLPERGRHTGRRRLDRPRPLADAIRSRRLQSDVPGCGQTIEVDSVPNY